MTKKRERPRQAITFTEKSMAKQSFREECDINTIMAKYRANGLIDHVARYGGRYEHLPSNIDYHDNLQGIINAQEAFASLPSKIRTKFDNDPEKFLGFVLDPANKDEVQELGLGAKPPSAGEPPAPAPTPEPTPPTPAE